MMYHSNSLHIYSIPEFLLVSKSPFSKHVREGREQLSLAVGLVHMSVRHTHIYHTPNCLGTHDEKCDCIMCPRE